MMEKKVDWIAGTIFLAIALFLPSFALAQLILGSDLESAVLSKLRDYYGAGAGFSVAVTDEREVRIRGKVRSYWDKRNVQVIVSRIRGVQAIRNELVIVTKVVPDAKIRANIETHLRDNMALSQPERIQVKVDSGRVTLSGEVNFTRESYLAEDVVSWQKGVTHLVNRLEILPEEAAMSDDRLSEIIGSLIGRFYSRDGSAITVTVRNGKVILAGAVDSLWTKKQIAKEVRKLRGVTGVDNQLQVGSPAKR